MRNMFRVSILTLCDMKIEALARRQIVLNLRQEAVLQFYLFITTIVHAIEKSKSLVLYFIKLSVGTEFLWNTIEFCNTYIGTPLVTVRRGLI